MRSCDGRQRSTAVAPKVIRSAVKSQKESHSTVFHAQRTTSQTDIAIAGTSRQRDLRVNLSAAYQPKPVAEDFAHGWDASFHRHMIVASKTLCFFRFSHHMCGCSGSLLDGYQHGFRIDWADDASLARDAAVCGAMTAKDYREEPKRSWSDASLDPSLACLCGLECNVDWFREERGV